MFRSCRLTIVLCLALTVSGLDTRVDAQTPDRRAQIVEIGGMVDFLGHVDTLYRLSEEIVFWQNVALTGALRGWEFLYSSSGQTDPSAYTLRLQNILGESEIEAARANQSLGRNRSVSEDQIAAAQEIFSLQAELRRLGWVVYDALIAGDIETAEAAFETETLPLRRDMALQAYSLSQGIRERIATMALDARLDR